MITELRDAICAKLESLGSLGGVERYFGGAAAAKKLPVAVVFLATDEEVNHDVPASSCRRLTWEIYIIANATPAPGKPEIGAVLDECRNAFIGWNPAKAGMLRSKGPNIRLDGQEGASLIYVLSVETVVYPLAFAL